jgi:hypothetical protein
MRLFAQKTLLALPKTIIIIKMASHPDTPIDLTFEALGSRFRSIAPSRSSLPSAFNRMINPNRAGLDVRLRDKCRWLKPIYNSNYNLYKKPRSDLFSSYTLYVFPEPLWDNRLVVVARFLKNYTLAKPLKKPRI